MTKEVVSQQPEKIPLLRKLGLLFGNGFFADIIGIAKDWHFDAQRNYQEITNYWNSLLTIQLKRRKSIIWFGRILHTVQDFYSHSNFVELYIQYCIDYKKQQEIALMPPFPQAIKDKVFESEYLIPKLHTGEFNLKLYLLGQDIKTANKKGLIHHNEMAKDSFKAGKLIELGDTQINTFTLAQAVAQKHTYLIFNSMFPSE